MLRLVSVLLFAATSLADSCDFPGGSNIFTQNLDVAAGKLSRLSMDASVGSVSFTLKQNAAASSITVQASSNFEFKHSITNGVYSAAFVAKSPSPPAAVSAGSTNRWISAAVTFPFLALSHLSSHNSMVKVAAITVVCTMFVESGEICSDYHLNIVVTVPAAVSPSDISFPAGADVQCPPGTSFIDNKCLAIFQLPPSKSNTLTRLLQNCTGQVETPVARSYDGLAWHAVPPNLATLKHAKLLGTSYIEKESGCTYRLVSTTSESSPQPAKGVAKLLSQATFGITQESLDDFKKTHGEFATTKAVSAWIDAQMGSSATSLRSYFRARTNPRSAISTPFGDVIGECDIGARFHSAAFDNEDEGSPLSVIPVPGRNVFLLSLNGVVRTEVDKFLDLSLQNTNSTKLFLVCHVRINSNHGRDLLYVSPVNDCKANKKSTDMPQVNFQTLDSAMVNDLQIEDAVFSAIPAVRNVLILQSLKSPSVCNSSVGKAGISFIRYNGTYYKHDPRVRLLENTVAQPAGAQSGSSICPAVVKTFLNEAGCQRKPSCSPAEFSSAEVALDETTLRLWYTASSKFVYAIQNLRLEAPYNVSPCKMKSSRWSHQAGSCTHPSTLDTSTKDTIVSALKNSVDTNPLVKDISVNTASCNTTLVEIEVDVEGSCYKHVHPDSSNVYDFTYWSLSHPGNQNFVQNNLPNPIMRWAQNGLTYLQFPATHSMSRWKSYEKNFGFVGRLGDSVDFRDILTDLQTAEVAQYFNASVKIIPADVDTCGSPQETPNNPLLGHKYMFVNNRQRFDDSKVFDLDSARYSEARGKDRVWTNVVLSAKDQLRQRVAWALSQILVIGESGLSGFRERIESWLTYYDIFVRHAFGNYRDILREVSYHPMMGDYLTFRANRAFASRKTFPDENYAREIMQLFSLGLWKRFANGTIMVGSDGNNLPTYDIEDIVAFSRVWTGFDTQPVRSNTEEMEVKNRGGRNHYDPMQIKATWRDAFPKTKLDSGYLGDLYPLCSDLPAQHFLKKGAKFIFTGDVSSVPSLDRVQNSTARWGSFQPQNTSALFKALCASEGGKCTFPAQVQLTTNLVCEGLQECTADSVAVVKIVFGSQVGYYDYRSRPCTRLTFPTSGKVSKWRSTQCADPETAVAGVLCCSPGTKTPVAYSKYQTDPEGAGKCLFDAERVKYSTAVARCSARNLTLCPQSASINYGWSHSCVDRQYSWVNQSCQVQLQVKANGQVNIVDQTHRTDSRFALNTGNEFKVRWTNGKIPTTATNCTTGCVVQDETCVCDITVTTEPVFTGQVPTVEDARSKLFLGSAPPDTLEGYSECTSSACQGSAVKVYTQNGKVDASAIFELPSELAGMPKVYLANKMSTVRVGESADGYSFRNPPNFMPLIGEARFGYEAYFPSTHLVPMAEQEVEALLDHLFEHNTTGPFIVLQLIQRLVTSNPSARYVESVNEAFRTGQYSGRTYSGRYGCMAATVAAILLDPEARSATLDLDPNHGRLREPLIKVIHAMRALQYQTRDNNEVGFEDISNRIGQQAFLAPSVFGFFLPEYQPEGLLGELGLTSPEAQLANAPLMVGFANGISSLINYGLTNCGKGFGSRFRRWGISSSCSKPSIIEQSADGELSFNATSVAVVDKLDLLLTGGRLNSLAKNLISDVYASLKSSAGEKIALKTAEKLVVASPEFHSTNANKAKGQRPPQPPSKYAGKDFKAVVAIFLNGGADSYNFIVPMGGCNATHDLPGEYREIRAENAIAETELQKIQVANQVCSEFGVMPELKNVKAMYDAKDASFVANVGALVEPVTLAEYKAKTKRLPPQLFAHNIMQRSMHNLDPANIKAFGVLNRMANAVESAVPSASSYQSGLYSLNGNLKMVQGAMVPLMVDRNSGFSRFEDFAQLSGDIGNITSPLSSILQAVSESSFAETYSSIFDSSLKSSEKYGKLLDDATLDTVFTKDNYVSMQFDKIAKLIKLRNSLKQERQLFIVQVNGFDTHNSFTSLGDAMSLLDTALGEFKTEMVKQGMWDNVAAFTVSDFGRTLTSNGMGTDHAWAGNHFLVGGGVKGGQFHGRYPSKLGEGSDLDLGRGRLLPTTSWEAIWKPVAEWFGVTSFQLDHVLPNAKNFPADQLINKQDMFQETS